MLEIAYVEPDAWKDDREPLFSIEDKDGEVTQYTIPREVPGSLALQAMQQFRDLGEIEGTAWLIEEMLGAKAVQALQDAPGLTRAGLAAIAKVIRTKVFDDPEDSTSEPGKR
jgi:hypothetical protein